jgi:hypothetical protein
MYDGNWAHKLLICKSVSIAEVSDILGMYSIMFESMSDACSCFISSVCEVFDEAATDGEAFDVELSSYECSVFEFPISKLLHVFAFFCFGSCLPLEEFLPPDFLFIMFMRVLCCCNLAFISGFILT